MRIVTAFAKQLGATWTLQLRNPSSEFTLLVPFESASQGHVVASTDPEAGYLFRPRGSRCQVVVVTVEEVVLMSWILRKSGGLRSSAPLLPRATAEGMRGALESE